MNEQDQGDTQKYGPNGTVEAQAQFSAAPAPWRPIETAPRDREILLWYPWLLPPRKGAPLGFVFVGHWYFADDGKDRWIDDDGDDIGAECTHWMPLPAPPEITP